MWSFVVHDLVAHRDALGNAAAHGAEVLIGKVLVARIRHWFQPSDV
jgi:hypothetical protein